MAGGETNQGPSEDEAAAPWGSKLQQNFTDYDLGDRPTIPSWPETEKTLKFVV